MRGSSEVQRAAALSGSVGSHRARHDGFSRVRGSSLETGGHAEAVVSDAEHQDLVLVPVVSLGLIEAGFPSARC